MKHFILICLALFSFSSYSSNVSTTAAAGGGGGGDVVGPASSLDNEVVLFDGLTGKLIKGGSGITSPASNQITFSAAGTVSVIDDTIADATKAANLTLRPSNKTAGTGDGGDFIIQTSTSLGGLSGITSIIGGSDTINIYSPSTGSLFIGTPRNTVVSGPQIVAIGSQAGRSIVAAGLGTFIGYQAGLLVTGAENTAIGSQALRNYSGSKSVGVGVGALYSGNNGAAYNVAIGQTAMRSLTSGNKNTSIGTESLFWLQSGTENTAVGWRAGGGPTSGAPKSRNVFLGSQTGIGAGRTPGDDNILLGRNANVTTDGASNEWVVGSGTSEIHNIYIGNGTDDATVDITLQHSDESTVDAVKAPDFTVSASSKTGVGSTGDGGDFIVKGGTSVGGAAGDFRVQSEMILDEGPDDVYFKNPNTNNLTIASDIDPQAADVTVVGIGAGTNNIGANSSLYGQGSAPAITSAAISSTCLGNDSCQLLSTGIGATAVGRGAGAAITTGGNITIVGQSANGCSTAINCMALGAGTDADDRTISNRVVIGSSAGPYTLFELGAGGQNVGANTLLLKHSENKTVDAVQAPTFTLRASDKSGSGATGRGGTMAIAGGLSNSGEKGVVQLETISHPKTTVNLTADNTVVQVDGISWIEISSDDAVAANRTFTLENGFAVQSVTLCWSGVNAGEMLDTGNHKLSADWLPDEDDCIKVDFDGTDWLEQRRSAN